MYNNLAKQLSTGNTLADILGGGLFGLADVAQPRGQYVPMFNWRGNGLATGGMQYLANPDYRNYGDAAQMVSSLFGQNDKGLTFGQIKNKLSEALSKPMFNDLLGGSNLNYPLKTETYQLPQIGNVGGYTIGNYGNEYNKNVYDYKLPTRQNTFKLPWE